MFQQFALYCVVENHFFLKLNFMEQHSFTGFMTGVIAELELRMAMATVTMT